MGCVKKDFTEGVAFQQVLKKEGGFLVRGKGGFLVKQHKQ